MLVDGVVREMYVLLVDVLGAITVLLGGESHETFFKDVNLKRVITRDEAVNSEIVLESIDQVWIRHILGDNIAWLAFNLCASADNFNTSAT